MKFNFETLTKEEFEGFVEDAQKLADQAKASDNQVVNLQRTLEDTQKQLEGVTKERDELAQAKNEADRVAALTAQIATMREEADVALAKQQCDPFEYKEYFGDSLAADVAKFGNDSIELKVAERWLSKVKERPASRKVNVKSLTALGKETQNGYTTTITADNLAE